ncbi:MAG: DUF86 domain-containing protein [Defluviitaleaceae bacterium]|nr:DUF86 domain-containing protein [Defluviitaleaceae bacterium]
MVDKNRRDALVAKKIIKEIDDIFRYTAGMTVDDFCADDRTQKAVAMTLINIGELSKSFSADFLKRNSSVPWKGIQATRNIAAHNYESFDFQIVWKTIQDDLYILKNLLTKE